MSKLKLYKSRSSGVFIIAVVGARTGRCGVRIPTMNDNQIDDRESSVKNGYHVSWYIPNFDHLPEGEFLIDNYKSIIDPISGNLYFRNIYSTNKNWGEYCEVNLREGNLQPNINFRDIKYLIDNGLSKKGFKVKLKSNV